MRTIKNWCLYKDAVGRNKARWKQTTRTANKSQQPQTESRSAARKPNISETLKNMKHGV
jgi:hypothetical protein